MNEKLEIDTWTKTPNIEKYVIDEPKILIITECGLIIVLDLNNYIYFFALLISYNVYNLIFILWGIITVFIMATDLENKILLITTISTLIIKVIISALTYGLMLFHIYLKWKGMNTFQFIVKRRKQKTDRVVHPLSKGNKHLPVTVTNNGSGRTKIWLDMSLAGRTNAKSKHRPSHMPDNITEINIIEENKEGLRNESILMTRMIDNKIQSRSKIPCRVN